MDGPGSIDAGHVSDRARVARSLRGSVGTLGGKWMLHGASFARAAELGMPDGMGAYAIGRFGVLGDVPADVVVAAAGFWPAATVTAMWEGATAQMAPVDGAAAYTVVCQEYGRRVFADFDGAGRLAELLGAVVSSADPTGAPLFAGWRAQPLADDEPARAYQLAQVMRELRFSRHVCAIVAAGLSGLEAVVAGPGGEANAKMFGWPEPYPDPETLAERRREAERLTDVAHGRDLECLDPAQCDELKTLAKAAAEHVG